jgi:hypothetical protein
MHDNGEIAAVIEDHVRALAIRPTDRLFDTPIVFLLGFALPREDGDSGGGDRRGGMILRRKDVATGPTHLGAQMSERFDQNGRLDGHMKATGDARAFERLFDAKFFAKRHKSRHFSLGDLDFLAAKFRERHVRDFVIILLNFLYMGGHTILLFYK